MLCTFLTNILIFPKSFRNSLQDVYKRQTVGSSTLLATFQPGASQVTAVIGETGKEVKMEMADEAGYFAALIPGKGVTDYVYRVEYPEGETEEIIDPYRFGPVITKKDTDLFAAGTHYEAYKILGAHSCCIDGVKGVHFAVWADVYKRQPWDTSA